MPADETPTGLPAVLVVKTDCVATADNLFEHTRVKAEKIEQNSSTFHSSFSTTPVYAWYLGCS